MASHNVLLPRSVEEMFAVSVNRIVSVPAPPDKTSVLKNAASDVLKVSLPLVPVMVFTTPAFNVTTLLAALNVTAQVPPITTNLDASTALAFNAVIVRELVNSSVSFAAESTNASVNTTVAPLVLEN